MIKRKFSENPEPPEKNVAVSNIQQGTEHELTIQCPHHDLPLQTETENRVTESGNTVFVRFAVCRCRVEGNNHYGQRVWEKS